MYFVTKQQPVVVGQCSRKDWTARLISTAPGTTTNMALVTWKVNFGWDWIRFTGWPQIIKACCVWTWRTLKGIQLMPSITCLVLWVRETSTSWSLVLIQVEPSFRRFYSSHSKRRGRGWGECWLILICLTSFTSITLEDKKVISAHRYAILNNAYRTLIGTFISLLLF